MSGISGSGFFLVISLGYIYSNEGSGLLWNGRAGRASSNWQTDFKFSLIRRKEKLKRYDRFIIVKKVQNKIPYLKEVSEVYWGGSSIKRVV